MPLLSTNWFPKKREQYHIISGLFRWDGTRIEGHEKIIIEKHDSNDGTWFYSLTEVPEYVFIRIPVHVGSRNQSAIRRAVDGVGYTSGKVLRARRIEDDPPTRFPFVREIFKVWELQV